MFTVRLGCFPWTTATSSSAKTSEFSIPRKKSTEIPDTLRLKPHHHPHIHPHSSSTQGPLHASTTHIILETFSSPIQSSAHAQSLLCHSPLTTVEVVAILGLFHPYTTRTQATVINSRKELFFCAPRTTGVPGLGMVPENIPSSKGAV